MNDSSFTWNSHISRICPFICFLLTVTVHAATHYVSLNGTNDTANGYPNWEGAATNIQRAVAAATAGDTVLVSNGTYYLTNQIDIVIAITTTSVNGSSVTIVDGNNYPGKPVTNRCFNLGGGCVLDGFTILNGNALYGGGIVIGAGTIRNSIIISNQCQSSSGAGGAGIYASANTFICNSVISYNVASNAANCSGGGIFSSGVISNCIINANKVWGVNYGKGGGAYLNGGFIYNSLIVGNYANNWAGGVAVGTVINCTIISNTADSLGGGIMQTKCLNSIIYFNICGSSSNYPSDAWAAPYATNCCIAPVTGLLVGSTNNTDLNPLFVDYVGGNYRLAPNSPCVNTGTNQNWMTNAVDLDNHSRIDRFSGIVDMGCFEYLPSGTMYSVP